MLETRKPTAKCLMELNMDGGRCWEGDCSAYEYNNLPFSFALYSLTMSGDRNWERDLNQRYCTCICFLMSFKKECQVLENHTHGMKILLYV